MISNKTEEMQGGGDAVLENQGKSRSDDDSIHFRPSPNSNMKKHWMFKFEEANQQQQAMANANAPQGASDSSSNGYDEREKVNKTAVQPPLPPNTPPPDTPPIINLKKEIEDDEYQVSTSENSDFTQPEELMTETIKTDKSEASETPEVTMCRNFVRGTCKKGASCIFAHELILSQLPGVYTFCRNFQNSVCTHPKCKFVHATVFEKEYFFRTGYLPPHTLQHLKEANVMQQPPPPPPPEETPQVNNNTLPTATVPSVKPVPVLNFTAAAPVERNDAFVFKAVQSPAASPKREWSNNEAGSSSSPRNLESCEPIAKRCKSCDTNELRVEYNKAKVEELANISAELRQNINKLNKKQAKLSFVLGTLLNRSETHINFTGIADTGTNGVNGLNTQIKNFLAKLLLSPHSTTSDV